MLYIIVYSENKLSKYRQQVFHDEKNDKLLHDARVFLLQNHHLPYNVKTADYVLILPNTG